MSRLARRKKCQNTCFLLEKRKKSKFNRLQIEVFVLPNISPLQNKKKKKKKRVHQFFPLHVLRMIGILQYKLWRNTLKHCGKVFLPVLHKDKFNQYIQFQYVLGIMQDVKQQLTRCILSSKKENLKQYY